MLRRVALVALSVLLAGAGTAVPAYASVTDASFSLDKTSFTVPSGEYLCQDIAVSYRLPHVAQSHTWTIEALSSPVYDPTTVDGKGPTSSGVFKLSACPSTVISGRNYTIRLLVTERDAEDRVVSSKLVKKRITIVKNWTTVAVKLKLSKGTQRFGKGKPTRLTMTTSPRVSGTFSLAYMGDQKKAVIGAKDVKAKKGKATFTFPKKLKKGSYEVLVTFTPKSKKYAYMDLFEMESFTVK